VLVTFSLTWDASLDSVATASRLDYTASDFRQGERFFLYSKTLRPALAPPGLLFSGYRDSFPEVKAAGA
jgi:hypothetical protein